MKLLTTTEAAERLHRSEPSVRRMCFDGKIRATKDGRQWLIIEEDLEDYIQTGSNRPRKRRQRAA